MRLYGLYLDRTKPDQENKASIAATEFRDGAMEINNAGQVNFSNQLLAIDGVGTVEDELKLITKYRELALQTEIDEAIQDIINEAFSYDEEGYPVEINLDAIPKEVLPDKIKDKIRDEYNHILNLMNFKQECYEIFRDWYVDGRLYYEMVTDREKKKDGIVELKKIDPRKIRRARETQQEKVPNPNGVAGMPLTLKHKYYYLYNPTGVTNGNSNQSTRLAPDQIAYCHSGVFDKTNRTVFSYLHSAIRPYNQYMNMKNSMVIYYHTRAPERRVFNIEIGNIPTGRANQYMQEVVAKHRRKETYDPNTGSVGDEKRYMTMQEDFFFPKRDGKGTDVNVLSGGTNLTEINEVVDMYKNELYRALRLPVSRYKEGGSMFNMGRSSEISRDELKFSKFISRLRKRFSIIFDEILGTHLVLKGILTIDEWDAIVSDVSYDFLQDSHFSELKNAEIWTNRINNFRDAEAFIGQYFSRKWAVATFLQMSEEEWDEMKKEIDKENEENPPLDDAGQPARGHPDFGKNDDEEDDDGSPPVNNNDGPKNPTEEEKAQMIVEYFQTKIAELERKLNEKENLDN